MGKDSWVLEEMTDHEKAIIIIKLLMSVADEGSAGHDAYKEALKAMEQCKIGVWRDTSKPGTHGKSRKSDCSLCGEWGRKSFAFCPHCGAKMTK